MTRGQNILVHARVHDSGLFFEDTIDDYWRTPELAACIVDAHSHPAIARPSSVSSRPTEERLKVSELARGRRITPGRAQRIRFVPGASVNATGRVYPKDGTVCGIFRDHAIRCPDAVALVYARPPVRLPARSRTRPASLLDSCSTRGYVRRRRSASSSIARRPPSSRSSAPSKPAGHTCRCGTIRPRTASRSSCATAARRC